MITYLIPFMTLVKFIICTEIWTQIKCIKFMVVIPVWCGFILSFCIILVVHSYRLHSHLFSIVFLKMFIIMLGMLSFPFQSYWWHCWWNLTQELLATLAQDHHASGNLEVLQYLYFSEINQTNVWNFYFLTNAFLHFQKVIVVSERPYIITFNENTLILSTFFCILKPNSVPCVFGLSPECSLLPSMTYNCWSGCLLTCTLPTYSIGPVSQCFLCGWLCACLESC